MADEGDRPAITVDQVLALKQCISSIRVDHQGRGNIRIIIHGGNIQGIYVETAAWLRQQKDRDDGC